MLSMAVQPNINAIAKPSTYPSPKLSFKPFNVSTFANPKHFSSPSFPHLKKKDWNFSLSAAPETISDVSLDEASVDIDDELPVNKEVFYFSPVFLGSFLFYIHEIWLFNVGFRLISVLSVN